MLDHLSEQVKHWLDIGAVTGAVVAGISLANAALIVTLIAGLISIVLGLIRIHDRLKYGKAI